MKSTTKVNVLLIIVVILVTVPFWLSISTVLDIDTRVGIRPYVDYLLFFGNVVIILIATYHYCKNKNKISLLVGGLSLLMILAFLGLLLAAYLLFG